MFTFKPKAGNEGNRTLTLNLRDRRPDYFESLYHFRLQVEGVLDNDNESDGTDGDS